MTITTTLHAIRKHEPCVDGWAKLLASLDKTSADDEPLPLLHILESNGFDDALWCTRALGPEHKRWLRLLACDFAESVLKYCPYGETRPAEAIRVARLFAEGEATQEELAAARDDADDAVAVACADLYAARTAVVADDATRNAAVKATRAAYDAVAAAAWGAFDDLAAHLYSSCAASAEQEQMFRAALAHEYRAVVVRAESGVISHFVLHPDTEKMLPG